VAYPGFFFSGGGGLHKGIYVGGWGGGCQQIQLRIEGRQNGDLGAVAPWSNLQMNETHILIRLLWMYIPQNWEFGSALAKLSEFGGVFEPPFSRWITARIN
jgi:hypothetical protein